jgi:hypothetical protein
MDWIAKMIVRPTQTLEDILHQGTGHAWFTPALAVTIVVLLAAAITGAAAVSANASASTGQTSTGRSTNAGNMGPMDFGGLPPSDAMPGAPGAGQTSGNSRTSSGNQSSSSARRATSTAVAKASTGSTTTASTTTTTYTGSIWFSVLASALGFYLSWLILAVLMNVIALAVGGQSHSKAAILITAWSFIPIGIRNLMHVLYYLVAGKAVTYPGLSGFLPSTDGNALTAFFQSLLTNADIYLVWQTVLLAIGIGLAAKLPQRKSVLTACLGIVILLAIQGLLASGMTLLGNLNLNFGSSLFFLRR